MTPPKNKKSIYGNLFLSVLLAGTTAAHANESKRITELFLFPIQKLSPATQAGFVDAISNPAWSKFDRVEAYQMPTDPSAFPEIERILKQILPQAVRPIDYQAQTLGSDGWEQIRSSVQGPEFYKNDVSRLPLPFWGVDVESLKFCHRPVDPSSCPPGVTPQSVARSVRSYLQGFIHEANAAGKRKDVWLTGNWRHFQVIGQAAPLIFTPDLVSQLDHVHWMDLPKLLTLYGGMSALKSQMQTLLQTTGKDKTVIQLGFLKDLSLEENIVRANQMIDLAQQLGISKFTVYARFSDMRAPEFLAWYRSLNK